MKKISILNIIVLLLIWGCETDEFDYGIRPEALKDFTLISPDKDANLLLNSAKPDDKVVIEWNESKAGLGSPVLYTWLADPEGNFDEPLLSLLADSDGAANKITFSHQELDNVLESLGVNDFQDLMWSVKADNGSYAKLAEDTFKVTINRFAEGIGEFDLVSPASKQVMYLIESMPDNEVVIDWEDPNTVGGDATFSWQVIRQGATFSEPLMELASDNSGNDSKLTLTFQQLDEALEGLGYAEAAPANLSWRVKATNGGFTAYSDQTFDVTIFRYGASVSVTFQLENSAEIPDGYSAYLAGEFGKLGVASGDWQQPGTNPDLKLVPDENGAPKVTFNVPLGFDNTSIAYKFFLAPNDGSSWSHGEQAFSETGCQGLYNGAEGTDNRKFTFVAGDNSAQTYGATVLTWEGFCRDDEKDRVRFVATVPENTPTDKDIYITGALGIFNWAQPGRAVAMRLRKVDGTDNQYEVYLPATVSQTFEYKYFLATTAAPAWGFGEQQIDGESCSGIDNRSFTYDGSNEASDIVEVWEGYCQ